MPGSRRLFPIAVTLHPAWRPDMSGTRHRVTAVLADAKSVFLQRVGPCDAVTDCARLLALVLLWRSRHAAGHRKVVQSDQGLRLHPTARRRQGCFRSYLGG